jgi:predicted transcriptional regulator YheO
MEQKDSRLVDVICINKALSVIEDQHQYLDHNTYYWKKYQPIFKEHKEYFMNE